MLRPSVGGPMRAAALMIGLLAVGCEDELSSATDDAAHRVEKASNQLRHERRELAHATTARPGEVADEVADVAQEASRLAEAQQDFERLKALRIGSLRAEHSVVAMQPLLIQAIA